MRNDGGENVDFIMKKYFKKLANVSKIEMVQKPKNYHYSFPYMRLK